MERKRSSRYVFSSKWGVWLSGCVSQVSGEFDYRDVFSEVSGNMEEESALILSREKLTSSSISRFKTELPFSLYISERQINNTGGDLSALEDHRIEDLKLTRPNLPVLRELSTGSEVLVLIVLYRKFQNDDVFAPHCNRQPAKWI